MRNFIFSLLIVSSPTMAYDFLPNPQTTPGLTSGHSIQEICSKGYPERMRNVSQKTKEIPSILSISLAERDASLLFEILRDGI
jgi:hypothetical protein